MGSYAYGRDPILVNVAGTQADDKDLLSFLVPSKRSVTFFGLKSIVRASPGSGAASKVEIVTRHNDSLLSVGISAVAGSVLESSATFPFRFINSLNEDYQLKFRMDGAADSATDVTVQLDWGYPGIKGEPA
jgi:hypothetical protein